VLHFNYNYFFADNPSVSFSGNLPYRQCLQSAELGSLCSACASGMDGMGTFASFTFIMVVLTATMRLLVLYDKYKSIPWLGDEDSKWAFFERLGNYLMLLFHVLAQVVWGVTCLKSTASQTTATWVPIPTSFIVTVLGIIPAAFSIVYIHKIHADSGYVRHGRECGHPQCCAILYICGLTHTPSAVLCCCSLVRPLHLLLLSSRLVSSRHRFGTSAGSNSGGSRAAASAPANGISGPTNVSTPMGEAPGAELGSLQPVQPRAAPPPRPASAIPPRPNAANAGRGAPPRPPGARPVKPADVEVDVSADA
jgi:hypothetical protein